MSARLAFSAAALSCLCSSAHAGWGGPLSPWRWAYSSDSVFIFTVDGRPGTEDARLAGISYLKGDARLEDSPELRAVVDGCLRWDLSHNWPGVFGLWADPPRTCMAFIGEELPGGSQVVPLASAAWAADALPPTPADPFLYRSTLTDSLAQGLSDPNELIVLTAAEALLRCPFQPDARILALVGGLADRGDGNARLLGLCCQALYGDHTVLPAAVDEWARAERPPLPAFPRSWLQYALRASSQAAAVPTLVGLLDHPDIGRMEREVMTGLVNSGLPEVMPAFVERLDTDDPRLRYWAFGCLSRVTKRHTWDLVYDSPQVDKDTMAERWRNWWGEEGRACFEEGQPAPAPVSLAGNADLLLRKKLGLDVAELAGRSVEDVALELAQDAGAAIGFHGDLDLTTPVPELDPETTQTVGDLATELIRAIQGEGRVWETGIAVCPEHRMMFVMSKHFGRRQFWLRMAETVMLDHAEEFRRYGFIRASSLPGDVWGRVPEMAHGRKEGEVDGVSLFDLPREHVLVGAVCEAHLLVRDETGASHGVYFGRGNLGFARLGTWSHVIESVETWFAAGHGWPDVQHELVGRTRWVKGVEDHTTPHFQLRFAAEAAAALDRSHAPQRPPNAAQIELPPASAAVEALVASIADAEGVPAGIVAPEFADASMTILSPGGRLSTLDARLMLAETLNGGWSEADGTLELRRLTDHEASDRRNERTYRSRTARCVELLRQADPELHTVWQAYASLGTGGDVARLPLALQQPLRIALREGASSGTSYRDHLWKPWRGGAVSLTSRLATQVFILYDDPEDRASWFALIETPAPDAGTIGIYPYRDGPPQD